MQTPESVASSQLDHDIILDTDPTVRMDIEFGQKLKPGQVIDVDYNALRASLNHVGANEDASDLTINMYSNNVMSTERGSYDNTYNCMYIGLSTRFANRKHYQKTIQHELKHYADREELSSESPLTKKIYDITTDSSPKIAKAAAGIISFSVVNNVYRLLADTIPGYVEPLSRTLSEKSTSISLLCIGALTASIAPYYINSHEIRARKAARKALSPVVVVNQTQVSETA